jgi:hypothetical protein
MPQHGKCSKHFKEEEDHHQEIRGLHCKNTDAIVKSEPYPPVKLQGGSQ